MKTKTLNPQSPEEISFRREFRREQTAPERTPFAERLKFEGLECISCLTPAQSEANLGYSDAAMVNGLLAKRFRRVYAIKAEMGLLSEFEQRVLPEIERLCADESASDQDDVWIKLHGDLPCLKPCYLTEPDCNLEYCLCGQNPEDAYLHGAREPENSFATLPCDDGDANI